jgi:hypothetical protein
VTSPQPTPVFLLSLPRSGSTLVQRVLAAHDGVATVAEPWVLLPWLSPLQERMPESDAWHESLHGAVSDFARQLPNQTDDYRRAVRTAAMDLYSRAAGDGVRFFIDKTPPYSMIVNEIAETFPDARLVFLWRNPLSVVSSVVETFAGGRWRPSDYPLSLFWGAEGLIEGYERHRDRSYGVTYESLIAGEDAWRGLCDYVGLDFQPEALERFSTVRLNGRMGDPTGVKRYQALSEQSLDKWRATVSSPLRKAWCDRYLQWLGRERLATMGYDLDELLADLDALRPSGGNLSADLADTAGSLARAAIKSRVSHRSGAAPWRLLLGGR